MKMLVIGAGALGGYFGGRLAAAGRDVTFLVRRRRLEQLAATGGLAVKSPVGDFTIANPSLTTADALARPYDLIFLTCKAFSLDDCIRDFAPAVGPNTLILPILNGMRHIEALSERFGRDHVLGGRANIFATLDAEGRVLHQAPLAVVTYGELDGSRETDRVKAVEREFAGAGFDSALSGDILLDMWEKWVFISAMAGITCLMRAAVGDIAKAGASPVALAICKESAAIAALNGYAVRDASFEFYKKTLTDAASTQSSSMLKDLEKGLPIESEQLIGDLFARIPAGTRDNYPMLDIVYGHLKSYEARREREMAGRG